MNEMTKQMISSLPNLLIGILIILVFWLLAKFAVKLIHQIRDRNPIQKQPVFLVFETLARTIILLLGLITALGSAGVNVSALVASLGISGIALTLATKDAFANLFAGILVILYQPFHIGDTIELGYIKGVVIKMSLRYTHLSSNNKEILIPNSSLLTKNLTIYKDA